MRPLQETAAGLLGCGHSFCNTGEELATELRVCKSDLHGALARNFATAQVVVRQAFAELTAQCCEEMEQYKRQGLPPPVQKRNRWALYTSRERVQQCVNESLEFVLAHPECRAQVLSPVQLRFLVLLQHFVAEDVADVYRPEEARRHNDAFVGFLTEGCVNSQLVKDAHRSEWSVEGRSFSMQGDTIAELPAAGGGAGGGPAGAGGGDRKRVIAAFQQELVTALETYLLDFCRRRGLLPEGTRRFLQAVTTQMSQCGLANLDRSSRAAGYFVGGQGLEQRTAYNISTADAGPLGEALQLSMFCMKTGFIQYHTAETLGVASQEEDDDGAADDAGPARCAPSSYLYQYATLRFVPCPRWAAAAGAERGTLKDDAGEAALAECAECVVVDALDEVHIDPEEEALPL